MNHIKHYRSAVRQIRDLRWQLIGQTNDSTFPFNKEKVKEYCELLAQAISKLHEVEGFGGPFPHGDGHDPVCEDRCPNGHIRDKTPTLNRWCEDCQENFLQDEWE